MSTGISISSINRIKELAEEKKFKEALEILDTQNLDKSINPQFLKISGEIFRENKRYYDSRRILLKAHQMAPEGNRILYELIRLYLELGYYSKAKKYYEQYLFNVTPEDTQKDYLEYMMKKAEGADVKELSAILIPILERMPEDVWNFEAVLLYHKMDRKDLALDESRYILENFKESEYIKPVIDYIDDKLDVDACFYVYPREEQPEDVEAYADLIALEEKLLEVDYLRMYPPEAKIMVEAEDNDAIPVIPVKEKKKKTRLGRKLKKSEQVEEVEENSVDKSSVEEKSDEQSDSPDSDVSQDSDAILKEKSFAEKASNDSQNIEGNSESLMADENLVSTTSLENVEQKQEELQKNRELALEKLLAKKIDTDKIKESAKQMAKAVKEIDTNKAKKQVKNVAETVKDNMKKATDAFGDAVGVKQTADAVEQEVVETVVSDEELILDGIIESVLEPPKKAVGQVVMNEELDALIPDSLEAMSEKEIADIEAKREEMERLELEALEANLKLEEERKAKLQSLFKSEGQEITSVETEDDLSAQEAMSEEEENDTFEKEVSISEASDTNQEVNAEANIEADVLALTTDDESVEKESATEEIHIDNEKQAPAEELTFNAETSNYSELKDRFIKDLEEVKPLESLGFITVVHSDVDHTMEENVPEAAGMLRQMIDNKEFYEGESSLGFESKASYENHGFEIEDYDFDEYIQMQEHIATSSAVEEKKEEAVEEQPPVQVIFAQESVVAFEDVAPNEFDVEEAEKTVSMETVHKETVTAPEIEEEGIADVVIELESATELECAVELESATEPEGATELEGATGTEVNEEVVIDAQPVVETETAMDMEPSFMDVEVAEAPVEEMLYMAESLYSNAEIVTDAEVTADVIVTEDAEIMADAEVTTNVEMTTDAEVVADVEVPTDDEMFADTMMTQESVTYDSVEVTDFTVQYTVLDNTRKQIRNSIIMTYRMESLLRQLKESR